LEGHVHPVAWHKPNPKGKKNDQTIDDINSLLANAANTLVNQNIRIN